MIRFQNKRIAPVDTTHHTFVQGVSKTRNVEQDANTNFPPESSIHHLLFFSSDEWTTTAGRKIRACPGLPVLARRLWAALLESTAIVSIFRCSSHASRYEPIRTEQDFLEQFVPMRLCHLCNIFAVWWDRHSRLVLESGKMWHSPPLIALFV
jgi:hypothetical protein